VFIGYLNALDREVRAAVDKGETLEETVKTASMDEYNGYKLYPWVHKQINVPHAYKRIKGME
jgi:cyclase